MPESRVRFCGRERIHWWRGEPEHMTIFVLLKLAARIFRNGQICVLWQVTDLRKTLGRDVGSSDALVDVAIWRSIMVKMR